LRERDAFLTLLNVRGGVGKLGTLKGVETRFNLFEGLYTNPWWPLPITSRRVSSPQKGGVIPDPETKSLDLKKR